MEKSSRTSILRTRVDGQNGQILAAGLVGLLLILTCLLFLFHWGMAVVQRERTRARTDAVAYGAAVDYARVMNVLSLSNKLLAASEGGGFLKLFPATLFLGWLIPSPTEVRKAQDLICGDGSGPGLGAAWIEASALSLAQQNGLWGVVLWNQDSGQKPGLKPSLNVYRAGMAVMTSSALLLKPGNTSGNADPGAVYSYRDDKGRVILVNPADVKIETYVRRDGHRQTAFRVITADGKSRFVKPFPGFLADSGPHNLTLLTWSDPASTTSFFGRMPEEIPTLVGAAKAEVGGGSMEVFGTASHGAYLVPVELSDDATWLSNIQQDLFGLSFSDILH
jgi:hypothetical protein